MKRRVVGKYVSTAIALLLCLGFIRKFGWPGILRSYVEFGIGSCQKIPILCIAPQGEITNYGNKDYLAQLILYNSPKIKVYLPKYFTVVQEKIKKVYYKKNKHAHPGAVIYLLYEEPNFFINLFPQLIKGGVKDNYEFIRRTMYARTKDIASVTDSFFVIMKGIFIPDLGDQKNIQMLRFSLPGKRGFINYNLSKTENYFDCNVIDDKDALFKIYIKDKGATLDLDKVLNIISTISKV
jgi:hypothetical protein